MIGTQRTGRIGLFEPELVVGQEQAVRRGEQAVGQVGQLVVVGDQLVLLGVQMCRAY